MGFTGLPVYWCTGIKGKGDIQVEVHYAAHKAGVYRFTCVCVHMENRMYKWKYTLLLLDMGYTGVQVYI